MDLGASFLRPAALVLAHIPLGLLLLCAPSAAALVLLLIEAALIRRTRVDLPKRRLDRRGLRHG